MHEMFNVLCSLSTRKSRCSHQLVVLYIIALSEHEIIAFKILPFSPVRIENSQVYRLRFISQLYYNGVAVASPSLT